MTIETTSKAKPTALSLFITQVCTINNLSISILENAQSSSTVFMGFHEGFSCCSAVVGDIWFVC